MLTQNQADVIRWWHGGCDYHQGVMLFARFSRNKTLIHTFMRKQPKFGQQKLNYELPKAVQLDWRNMPEQEVAEKFFQDNQNEDAQSGEKVQEQAIINAKFTVSRLNPGSGRNEDELLRFSKNIPLVSEKRATEYPKIIRRIKYHYASLYKSRSMLHRQMAEVAHENTSANKKKRASLFAEIKTLSIQMVYYYQFILEYESNGTVPDEDKVQFPEEEKQASESKLNPDETSDTQKIGKETGDKLDNDAIKVQKEQVLSLPAKTTSVEEPDSKTEDNNGEEQIIDITRLKRRKKNLQTANTKDKNMLLYQDKSRQEKQNPMPAGPKREMIEKRIRGREEEIKGIEQQLLNPEF